METGKVMDKAEVLKQYSPYLFWDVNRDNLDMDRSARYIIDRVLSHGLWEDWVRTREYYGLDKIREITMQFRVMTRDALSYIATVTNTPQTQFRCYENIHSPNAHWEY